MQTQQYIDQWMNWISPLAKKDGVSFDFYASINEGNAVIFEESKLKNCTSSSSLQFHLRISNSEQSGTSYVENFQKENIQECYKQAYHSLSLSDKKERGDISKKQSYPDLSSSMYNSHLASFPLEKKIENTRNCHQASASFNKKVQPIISETSDQTNTTIFGNSDDNHGSYKANVVMAYSCCLAIEGDCRISEASMALSRRYTDIDFQKIGNSAASKAFNKLSFIVPKTGSYPVVFQSDRAAILMLSLLVPQIHVEAVYNNFSLLIHV